MAQAGRIQARADRGAVRLTTPEYRDERGSWRAIVDTRSKAVEVQWFCREWISVATGEWSEGPHDGVILLPPVLDGRPLPNDLVRALETDVRSLRRDPPE